MNHFALEIPDCASALVAFSPTNSANVNTNPSTGIYGLEWHLFTEHTDLTPRSYSYTFAGDLSQGFVATSIKAGNDTEVGEVPGPCQGYYISGRVFVDTDSAGNLGAFESASGIPSVTGLVSDGNGCAQVLTTDENGSYQILVGSGTYTVSVSSATPENDFNEELFDSFDPTTALSFMVITPPDAGDVNFGFNPQTE